MINSRKFVQGAIVLFGCAAAIISLSSCSMKKKMDGMAQNTEDMKNTTGKMANTTEGMAKTTEGLAKTTEEMKKTTEEMKKNVEATQKISMDLLVQNRPAVAKKTSRRLDRLNARR
jgi:methyl-accepting chemotaxis protein